MTLLMIGLGRMGLGLAETLRSHSKIFGFDPLELSRMRAGQAGVKVCKSLTDLASQGNPGQRIFWTMVPARVVGSVLDELFPVMGAGDIIVEGGNSFYKDSIARADRLKEKGVDLLDVGVSGGIHGKEHGYCLMVGGEKRAYEKLIPYFEKVSQPNGVRYMGPSGSGHFVKMVHNAVEYGMLQVLGEGFELLKAYDAPLNLKEIADVWNHGSVVRCWLLDLLGGAVSEALGLENTEVIGGGETGIWAVKDSLERKVPTPAISTAVNERLSSQRETPFARQLISLMRHSFGGHLPPKRERKASL